MMTETDLYKEVYESLDVYEKLTGQYATRARRMIETYGVIEALSKLVSSGALQSGFKKLRDNGILERYSFEALVVKYACLFKPDIVRSAQWRLDKADEL